MAGASWLCCVAGAAVAASGTPYSTSDLVTVVTLLLLSLSLLYQLHRQSMLQFAHLGPPASAAPPSQCKAARSLQIAPLRCSVGMHGLGAALLYQADSRTRPLAAFRPPVTRFAPAVLPGVPRGEGGRGRGRAVRRAVSTSPLAVRRPVPAPPPSEHESGPPAVLGSRCVKLPRGRPGAWLALRARGAKAPGSRARVRSVRLGAWGGGRRDLVNLDGGGGGGAQEGLPYSRATHRTAAQRARSTFSRRLSCGSLSGERGVCVAQSTRSRYTPESGSARRHRGEREIGSFSCRIFYSHGRS